jgi:thiamine-monophosphate kinase
VEEFSRGLGALAAKTGIQLVGGDTTSGPLSITITAMGQVDQGSALLRSGAKPGDLVVVSGTPGLAALGLAHFQAGESANTEAWRALTCPEPRLKLGQALRGKATACIDVSDGLSADLGHILQASGVGAQIWLDRLPRPPAMKELPLERCWDLQLGGGDDYELCFSLPPALEPELSELSAKGGVELTVLGRITSGHSLQMLKADGSEFTPARRGQVHFVSPR